MKFSKDSIQSKISQTFCRRNMSCNLITICVFASSIFASYGQYVKHWTGMENLSTESVEDIITDASGFLWFATNGGLSRFNGYNFQKFTTANLEGLPANEIKSLRIDDKQQLWIATTENGIGILNLTTYKITNRFNNKNGSTGLRSNRIAQIEIDAKKTVWVSTEEGFLHKYLGNGKFLNIKNPFQSDALFGSYPRMTSDANFLYVYTINRGVYTINLKTNKVVANFGTELQAHSGMINNIDGVGVVFCAKEGAMKINSNGNTFSPIFSIAGDETFASLKDQNGDIWMVQKDRKQVQIISGGSVRDLTPQLFRESDNVHISKIFEDLSHNIWICSTNGVYKITNDNIFFSSVLKLNQWKGENYIPSFRGMMEDIQGELFFGGYSGLFKQKKNGEIVQLFDNKTPYTPYVLINKNADELWALCEGYGVVLVNKTSGEIRQFEDNLSKIEKYKGIYLISGVQAEDQNLWLGSYDGILRFDTKKEKYYTQKLEFNGHQIHKYRVRQFIKSRDNHIWICTNSGVFVLDEKNKPIAHYHDQAKGIYHIPFNDVNCIAKTGNGRIWIGSKTSGAFLIGSNNNKSIYLNSKLSDNSIASIIEDSEQNIWFSSNNGLSKYNLKTGEISNYFVENGLSNNEFNHGSFLKTKKGDLYFGGTDGINIYNPKRNANQLIVKNKINISRLEIPTEEKGIKVYYGGGEFINGISLPYNKTYLYLEFFINDFTRSESNTYEYLIEGNNSEWQSLNNQNFIRIVGLAPGNYTLRIRGMDAGGEFVSNELIIPIQVAQIFYKTWWFIFLNISFWLSLIGFYFYKRFKERLALSEMRINLASDLHDDVGSALTRIAMQSEMLVDEVREDQKNILHVMSVDARKAMTSMRDMVWSIDTRNLNITSLYDKINEFAQKTLGDLCVTYSMTSDPAMESINLTPLQKKEIYYIVKEALTNALKHGNGTEIKIDFFKQNGNFNIKIQNGTDQIVTGSVTGIGIKNIEMRAKRIGANVQFITDDCFTMHFEFSLKKLS